jgi:predicted small secreted protein
MIRIFVTLIIVSGGLALAACNTVHGVGKDVESVGKKIQ